MTAQEFFIKHLEENEYFLVGYNREEEIIALLNKFAKLKCQELYDNIIALNTDIEKEFGLSLGSFEDVMPKFD